VINWKHIENLRFMKRFCDIVYQYWQLQIFFADRDGHVLSPAKRLISPFCNLIHSTKNGLTLCNSSSLKAHNKLREMDRPFITTCDAECSSIMFPIRIKGGHYIGALIVSPFLTQELSAGEEIQLAERLSSLGIRSPRLVEDFRTLPVLPQHNLLCLTELVKLLIEEIIKSHIVVQGKEKKLSVQQKLLDPIYRFDSLTSKNESMRLIFQILQSVILTDTSVLIEGESGVGKGMIAQVLHNNGLRRNEKFVSVNCSSFNDNLLESELFGHVKGAFTGAIKDKKGLFEVVDKGDLFLDEIGDMSTTMQAKFLQVLEERIFMPVGSSEPKKANFRLISATNKCLSEEVKKGNFREDLYYRINVISIHMPPLRERREDLPDLVDYFLDFFALRYGRKKKILPKEILKAFYGYHWPGNIRELRNEIEKLTVLSGTAKEISKDFLSSHIQSPSIYTKPESDKNLWDILAQTERKILLQGLHLTFRTLDA